MLLLLIFRYILENVCQTSSVAKLEVILGIKRKESQVQLALDKITEESANDLDISSEFIKILDEYNQIKKKSKESVGNTLILLGSCNKVTL